jgi:hypothetical protein
LILAKFKETLFFIVSGAMFQSLEASLIKAEVIILLLPGSISDTLFVDLVLETVFTLLISHLVGYPGIIRDFNTSDNLPWAFI